MTLQKEWQDHQNSIVEENNELYDLEEELDQITNEMRLEFQAQNYIENTHFAGIRDRRLDKYKL